MNGQPEPRIGDQERIAAADALGEHFAAGRLSKDEYDERSTQVWAAKTDSDLRPLFLDLPALGTPVRPFPSQRPPQRSAAQRSTPRGGWPSAPQPAPRRGFQFPWLPMILVVVGLMLLLPGPWWLILAGAFVFLRSRRHGCHGHVHGHVRRS